MMTKSLVRGKGAILPLFIQKQKMNLLERLENTGYVGSVKNSTNTKGGHLIQTGKYNKKRRKKTAKAKNNHI